MRTEVPALLPLFRSEFQLRLLDRAMARGNGGVTAERLAADLGAPRASVHRELKRAVDAGLVTRDAMSRPYRYVGAEESKIFAPVRELLDRTVGVEPELAKALGTLDGVNTAVIHGSWAAGTPGPSSDIDVLVLGTADLNQVRRTVRPVGRRAGRHVDITLFRPSEVRSELAAGSPFLEKIARGPRIALVGDLDQSGLV